MDANFLATTDMESVEKAAAAWARTARHNHLYSMADITEEIYGAGFDTDEFWRVVMHIGPAIAALGFKRTLWKNRRWWVRKVGAGDTVTEGHNAKVSGPEAALSPDGRARLPGSAAGDSEKG